MIEGLKPDDKSMQPVSVILRSPVDGKSATYKVIGVLDANNMVASAALDLPTGATVVCAFGATLLVFALGSRFVRVSKPGAS